jgi:hypothetical protein
MLVDAETSGGAVIHDDATVLRGGGPVSRGYLTMKNVLVVVAKALGYIC